jgi:dTDP-glucose 4,6-dehydratase
MRSVRYLVTGAAGFIGSHLCGYLLEHGHQVLGADNYLTGLPRNLKHLENHHDFRLIEQDVSHPFKISGSLDGIFHLASPASPKDYLQYPVETLMVGSTGTKNLLDLAHRLGARFLLASTSECYGDPLEHPQKETYWGNVNPVGPRSCYDESKRFAEALTMAYHRKHGLRTNIARIFNTYGPRMKLDDGRIVPGFVDQALRGAPMTVYGDGRQTRSFCYVSDLVDGLAKLAASDEPYPVNLGNPEEIEVLEFARRIRDLTGSTSEIMFLPLPEDDPRRRRPDITKAKRLLRWEPLVGLDAGLQKTISYFRQVTG